MTAPPVEIQHRKLLSVEEAAALLGLGRNTVRALLVDPDEDRRLPAFQHGSRWCIPTHLLDGWAAAQVANKKKDPNK